MYDNLNKYLEKKGLKVSSEQKKSDKEKFKGRLFSDLTAKDKDELLEKMLRDFGYID